MATEPRLIHVEPDTEIGKLLDEVDGHQLLLEKQGVLYRVSKADHEDVWLNYDPDAVKKALRESAGAFANMDTEKLKRDLSAAREQDSRGRPA